jgi:hypothetical protein
MGVVNTILERERPQYLQEGTKDFILKLLALGPVAQPAGAEFLVARAADECRHLFFNSIEAWDDSYQLPNLWHTSYARCRLVRQL